ncbi:hypothetical protein, partial [Weissella confusa]|uniref:hypothetical protein n=1 Tax=Weissella confusa TaxID=1583 RepID=UPI001F31D0CF
GYFGQTGCSWSVLFYFYTQKQKKVPTTNRVSEWSSVPNILEPVKSISEALHVVVQRFLLTYNG